MHSGLRPGTQDFFLRSHRVVPTGGLREKTVSGRNGKGADGCGTAVVGRPVLGDRHRRSACEGDVLICAGWFVPERRIQAALRLWCLAPS